MNKKAAWKTIKTILIAIPVLLLVIAVFLLNWLRERKPADYKQFFADNQQELTLYADAFGEQNAVAVVSRSRDFNGIGYSISTKRGDTHGENDYISFTVPFWENIFWRVTDLSEIKAHDWYPGMTLGAFLEVNGIPEEEFLKWRGFLAKYDFLSIGYVHGKEDQVVNISKTSLCGFEYRKEMGIDFGYGTSYMDVLNSYWIYYDEDGVHHFPDR